MIDKDRAEKAAALAQDSGTVNLSDARGLADMLGLPEALVARQPRFARQQLFAERMRQDGRLLQFAEQDGARASIAQSNFQEMQAIGEAMKNTRPLQEMREEWQKLPGALKKLYSDGMFAQNAFPYENSAEAPTDNAANNATGRPGAKNADSQKQETRLMASPETGGTLQAVHDAEGNVLSLSLPAMSGYANPGHDWDYFLDPFKNFANGWLDIGKSVFGTGQAGAELVLGQGSAVSAWLRNWVKMIESLEFETSRATSYAGELARDVVRNSPQFLAQVGLWFVNPAASSSFMFQQIFGGDYIRHRAQGISPENAAFAGAVDAALQSALERVGMRFALGQGRKLFGKTLPLASLGDKLSFSAGKKAWLAGGMRGATAEAVTEAVQYAPDYLTSWWAESSRHAYRYSDRLSWFAREIVDIDNLLAGTRQALHEGLVGGILGGGAGSVSAYAGYRQNLRAEERRLLDAQAAQAARVIERLNFGQAMTQAREIAHKSAQAGDYAGLSEMIEASLPENGTHAWLAPEDFQKLMQTAPEYLNEYAQALNLPPAALSRFMEGSLAMQTRIAPILALPGKAGELLQDALRIDPDGVTFNQAALWNPELILNRQTVIFNQDDEDLEAFEDNEIALAEAREIRERRSRMKDIHAHVQRLAQEMTGLGFSGIEARTNADLIEAHVLTMWKTYGLDPLSFLEGFKIEAGPSEEVFAGEDEVAPDIQTDAQPQGQPDIQTDIQTGAPVPEDGFSRENGDTDPQNGGIAPDADLLEEMAQPIPETGTDTRTGMAPDIPADTRANIGQEGHEDIQQDIQQDAQPAGQPDIEQESRVDVPTGSGLADAIDERLAPPEPNDGTTILNSDRLSRLRGQALITASSRIIRLFSGRDVSTLPHEASHIFIDNLLRVAVSDGSFAIDTFRRELAGRKGSEEILTRANELLAQNDHAEAMRMLAHELGPRAAALKGERKALAERIETMKKEGRHLDENGVFTAEYEQMNGRVGQIAESLPAILAAVRHAKRAARHIDAISQANEDVNTLANHAGLSRDSLNLVKSGLDDPRGEALLELRALQEAGARGFEQYMRDVKAPSARLLAVFRRFADWLSRLWQNVRPSLGRAIGPEMAAVYDRLLATNAEMEAYGSIERIRQNEQAFADLPGMDPQDRRTLRDLLDRVRLETVGRLSKSLARQRERYRRERTKALAEQLRSDPFWQLAEDEKFTREEIIAQLGERLGPELMAAWPRILGNSDISIAERVEIYGYESAGSMFQDLHSRLAVRHETRRGLAEQLVAAEIEEMEREDGLKALSVSMERMSEYLDHVDVATARYIARLHLRTEKEVAAWTEQTRTPRQLVRNQADALLEFMPIREQTQARFQNMLHKALAERARLIASGKPADLMKALEKVQEARVAMECLETLSRSEKEIAKFRKKLRKVINLPAGSIEVLHMEALRKLFAAFRLGNLRATEDLAVSSSMSLSEMVERIAGDGGAAGIMPVFSDWLLKGVHPQTGVAGPLGWRELSLFELRELESLIDWLHRGGADEAKASRNSLKAEIDKMVDDCIGAMDALPAHERAKAGSMKDRAQGLIESLYGHVDSLVWQSRKADGLTNLQGEGQAGPLESLFREALQREENVRSWTDRAVRALTPHLEQLDKCRRRLEKTYGRNLNLEYEGREITPPENWVRSHGSSKFTVEMILAMACHLGNVSNQSRLFSGYLQSGLNYDTMAAIFGSDLAGQIAPDARAGTYSKGLLTAEDWHAIQGIWDSLQIFWPDTEATHRRLFGFAPPVVGHRSLRFMAADGQLVQLSGGYFPVRYDPRISDRVGAWTEQEDLFARNMSLYNTPSAKRGHTKARTKEAPGLPVRLDLDVISEHISDAARFIEYAELVRKMDRIITHPAFRSQYIETWGREDYDAIRPNLRGLVRQEKPDNVLGRIVQKLRPFMAAWGLAFNFNAAIVQATAIFPAMSDLGPTHVLRGLAFMATHGLTAARQIWKASPYMLSRLRNIDQDLQRHARKLSPQAPRELHIGKWTVSQDTLVDMGMSMIVAVDACATTTVWLAAYNKKLRELRKLSRENPAPDAEQNNAPNADPASGPNGQPGNRPAGQPIAGPNPDNNADNSQNPRDSAANETPENGATDENTPRNGKLTFNPLAVFRPFTRNLIEGGSDVIVPDDPFHYEAARFADLIVKQSNPDYDAPSRSAFLRAKGINSVFNMFASAVTLFSSRARFLHQARKKGKFKWTQSARENFFTYLLPSIALSLFYGAAQGWGGEGDGEGDWLRFAARVTLDQFFMKIPVFSSAINNIIRPAVTGEAGFGRSGMRTMLDEPVRIAGSLAKTAALPFQEGELTDRQIRAAFYSVFDAGSYMTKIPASRIAKRAERGLEQWEEGRGTFLSPLLPR